MKKIMLICIGTLGILILLGIFYYINYYPYTGNAGTITEQLLECGAYYGDYSQKKIGTPDNWVHSSGGMSSFWHRPNCSLSCIWSCHGSNTE